MINFKIQKSLVLGAFTLLLIGCGQTGPLILPEPSPDNKISLNGTL